MRPTCWIHCTMWCSRHQGCPCQQSPASVTHDGSCPLSPGGSGWTLVPGNCWSMAEPSADHPPNGQTDTGSRKPERVVLCTYVSVHVHVNVCMCESENKITSSRSLNLWMKASITTKKLVWSRTQPFEEYLMQWQRVGLYYNIWNETLFFLILSQRFVSLHRWDFSYLWWSCEACW